MLVGATSGRAPDDPPFYAGSPLTIAWPRWVVDWAPTPFLASVGTGLVSLALRFRRSRGDERQQLKWLAAAGIPLAATFIPFVFRKDGGGVLVSAAAVLLVAIPVAVAITRFRLYDLDLIISQALVYAALSLLIAAVYLVLAAAISRLVGGQVSTATATLATVGAALAALVARQAIQQLVSRLLFGRRRDPLQVLGGMARRLEAAGAPEGLVQAVVSDLVDAMKLGSAAAYAVDGELLAGSAGVGESRRLALLHQGEQVGQLEVWTRCGDGLAPRDLRLLEDLGPQLAVAIEAVRLERDLRRARERLVVAREEERRRLRRDLHDGLGPTLTAITFRADAVTNLLEADPARARALLIELRAAAAGAIVEVRSLINGLRPAALDELGLLGAIREQSTAATRFDVVVDGDRLPPLPAAVEVAAYRIATEAITNSARHSGAQSCRVSIVAGMDLELEVTDDGSSWVGRLMPGVGIQSMRERAAELGGRVTFERTPTGGTTVRARLPLGPATEP